MLKCLDAWVVTKLESLDLINLVQSSNEVIIKSIHPQNLNYNLSKTSGKPFELSKCYFISRIYATPPL